jgi:hypothetical protein
VTFAMLQWLAIWPHFLIFHHFSRVSFSAMTDINNATRNDELLLV